MVARLARTNILSDGCCLHVISRSIRKLEIFRDDEDFEAFRELLIKIKQEYGLKVLHYCLMSTHFHLAIKISTAEGFIRGLQKLKSQYVYKFHSKYRLSGPIWRERFRSLLVEDETYLYACGQYIENNPVKAGLVKENMQWKHSSSRHYQNSIIDPVVDGYEAIGLPQLPGDIDLSDKEIFKFRGHVPFER